mgnify:CR=1 FL=1
MFSAVLASCEAFLKENPTEVILMSIKREAGKSEEETFDFFYNTYAKNNDIFYLKNEVPFLNEVRGKIVLFNRCGADIKTTYTDENTGINLTGWPYQNSRKEAKLEKVIIAKRNAKSEEYFYLQDFFNLKPKKKWELAVMPTIHNAPQDNSIKLEELLLFELVEFLDELSLEERYIRLQNYLYQINYFRALIQEFFSKDFQNIN